MDPAYFGNLEADIRAIRADIEKLKQAGLVEDKTCRLNAKVYEVHTHG